MGKRKASQNARLQYQRWDSNPYGRSAQGILSPSCLPIPPLRQRFEFRGVEGKEKVIVESTYPTGYKKRARDGIRTRDPDLGKVVLYQLSYSRFCSLLGMFPKRIAKVMNGIFCTTERSTFFKKTKKERVSLIFSGSQICTASRPWLGWIPPPGEVPNLE